jgi:hypothetical protein
LFVDPLNNDYSLQENSPCISTGRYGDDRGALPYIQTAIDDDPNQPKILSLFSCYPNPFNASTTISYSLPEASTVTIEIYDILGGRVVTLFNREQTAGYHRLVWNAANMSSGTYFYKIVAGDYSEIKKMSLLK